MDDRLKKIDLIKVLPHTFTEVSLQLTSDEKRYGDTWKERGLVFEDEDQETRWFNKMVEYFGNYVDNGVPIPWNKVIGEAHICKVREKILK